MDTPPMADAPPDAHVPTCAGVPFTTSTPIPVVNSSIDETYLRLSPDELTAYFVRQDSATTNPSAVFVATRTSLTSDFAAATALNITGNGGLDVVSPSVTGDGLTMYFVSARTGTLGGGDIWVATRAATSADFGDIAHLNVVNSTFDEMDVFVVPDGSAIYFSSSRTNNIYTIWRAQKNGATFDAPVEVLSQAPSFINRVVVSADELKMAYQIGNDLRLTARASKTAMWYPGIALDKLNSVNADNPTWLSPDQCRLYFQTNRTGSLAMDFHVAVREPE